MLSQPSSRYPLLTSLSLSLSLFLSLLPLSQQTVSPPHHLGGPQLDFLPEPSPSPSSSPITTAPPTYSPDLNLLHRRQGQGQSQSSGSCPSGQVPCGSGCAYDCCDGQAGANGWACRVSGEKCFTKGGYVGCCKGRDCPQKRHCYNYPLTVSCDVSTGSCLACTDSATGYCVTETNPAVGLSVFYCATTSLPLSFVTGTALRPLASAESGPSLGQGILVTNSLSSPGVLDAWPTMSGSVSVSVSGSSSSSSGLSRGDIAGITIGTVAVVSFIVFGAIFLFLRHRKLAAGAAATEPQAAAPMAGQPPSNGLEETMRPDIPAWPVEADGTHESRHELRHWIPQELDGGEIVVRKQDAQGREPESGSTLVSPTKDDVEGLGQERHPT